VKWCIELTFKWKEQSKTIKKKKTYVYGRVVNDICFLITESHDNIDDDDNDDDDK
jgi:hypothetical protein